MLARLLRVGCGLPVTLLCGLLALMAIANIPLWIDSDAVIDREAVPPTEAKVSASIRHIRILNDHEAEVVRYPSTWQRIDLATGAELRPSVNSSRYHGVMQRVGTPDASVVYLDHDGCYQRPVEGNQPAQRVIPFLPGEAFTSLAASPAHPLVALCDAHRLEVWSLMEKKQQASLAFDHGLSSVNWSPDGHQLLVLLNTGVLQILDGTSLAVEQSQSSILRGSGHVVWAQSGNYVAGYDDSGHVVTWNITTSHVESHATDLSSIRSLAFAPHGDFVVIPDAVSDLWVLPTQGDARERRYLGSADALVSALSLFNGGQSLLVGTTEGTLECWSTQTGLPLWNRGDQTAPTDESSMPITPIDRASPFAQHGNCDSAAAAA